MIQKINDEINKKFQQNIPFSLIRIGNMEGYFLECLFNNVPPLEQYYQWLSLTSGVYPVSDDYLKNVFFKCYKQVMQECDILGFVDISGNIRKNEHFKKFFKDKISFFAEEIECLSPGHLLTLQNPWTKNLKGKKVLVISSFENTIKSQWNKIEKVWGEHTNKIVPFELVGVVRSPFHPAMDHRQFPGCDSWGTSLEHMCQEIKNYDYDVALIGSGAYSPPLANFVKTQGKIGITICGAIQVFFGIFGNRWKNVDCYKKIYNTYFNEYWTLPFEEELPSNKEVFENFEKAYW